MKLKRDPFASAFRTAREDLELTQEQAASKLEVTKSTVQNWEGGRTGPRYNELLRVCLLFGWQLPWEGDAGKRATAR